ncbi:hypothetical protein Ancab_016153, partial [Ancistrocladus abbreviatus]
MSVLQCQGHDIHMPHGIEITTVADIEIHPEEVGNSLQFLEFCATFGEILAIEEGQPESILQDIMRGHSGEIGNISSVKSHLQLLALLQDSGN